MMSEYARYFKQQLLSDCDLVISWPKSNSPRNSEASMDCCSVEDQQVSDNDQDELPRASCSFPAHQLMLFKSSHFEAQGLRWQQPSVLDTEFTQQTVSNQQESSAAVVGCPRTEFVLSIDAEEQLPAAEAVIAALYGAYHYPFLLPHDQLVHALVIADMLALPEVADQIIQLLKAEATSATGLSSGGLETMAKLSAWPDCMYQLLPHVFSEFTQRTRLSTGVTELGAVLTADKNGLLQQIMLAAFGNLQAVWQNASLSKMLMKLPLPAIQLLLSSDELQVPSEDIVLYTVEKYSEGWLTAKGNLTVLSSVVRAPYLSDFALQFVALSSKHSGRMQTISLTYQLQLQQLITLRRLIGSRPLASELEVVHEAPHSWLQGPRRFVSPEPASVVWRLPIQQLADACKKAVEQKSSEEISGPEGPPMGGLTWRMCMHCQGQENGTRVGLFV